MMFSLDIIRNYVYFSIMYLVNFLIKLYRIFVHMLYLSFFLGFGKLQSLWMVSSLLPVELKEINTTLTDNIEKETFMQPFTVKTLLKILHEFQIQISNLHNSFLTAWKARLCCIMTKYYNPSSFNIYNWEAHWHSFEYIFL